MARASVLVIVVATLTIGACSRSSSSVRVDGTTTPSVPSIERGATSAPPGRSVVASLYTHCGIYATKLDGAWYLATPPVSPRQTYLAGWRDPVDTGTMHIRADGIATFTSQSGNVANFKRAQGQPRARPCF
jgi:hypothetical protein